MSGQLAELLIAQGVTHEHVRAVDHRILPGVETDYKDLEEPPSAVQSSMSTAVANAVHLARSLKQEGYGAPR